MLARNVFHVLLMTADGDLAELYRQDSPQRVVTIAKDATTAARKLPKRPFDAIIMESRKDWMEEIRTLRDAVSPAPRLVVVGDAGFLRRSTETVKALTNGESSHSVKKKLPEELGFDEYIPTKLRDFVRRMKIGAGSNLHALLTTAVEKPLITLVLEETGGNQIQAAALLGLSRNTLRKKITKLGIPLSSFRQLPDK